MTEQLTAQALGNFFDQERSLALWTRLVKRLVPDSEFTVGIVVTTIEFSPALRLPHHDVTAVPWTGNSGALQLDIPTLRVTTTRCKLPETTMLKY